MALSYQVPGLILKRGSGGAVALVKDLQRHLRQLGYLRTGIDGDFGRITEAAVMALQFDLLHNKGEGNDGKAPVRVRDYNKDRVSQISGAVDQNTAACIADMLADDKFCKVPFSENPSAENAKIPAETAATKAQGVPGPFLAAILKQESDLKHFCEPSSKNEDSFMVVGLDRNKKGEPAAITSRGYGVGQYTLFHHPPAGDELSNFIADVRKNVAAAAKELRTKFDHFVNGKTSGTRADDRIAEFGKGPLRVCKFAPDDPRFLADCRQCLIDAGTTGIKAGVTRFYEGTTRVYEPTQYHHETQYTGVPVRKNVGCDWPYAVRRYNGGGVNSYHYQTKVLLRVVG